MKTNTGFTLVELMLTLAVAAILTAVAVPSFRQTIMDNRLTTQSNEFITALNIARSEAVKRGETVTVASKNGTSWQSGWTITDSQGNVLRDHNALDGTTTLTGSVSTLQYQQTGFLGGTSTLTFSVCDSRTGETGRQVTVLVSGRPDSADLACS